MPQEKVSIVKCNSYNQQEVDQAIQKALDLINFKFKPNQKVLIKPNVLGAFPKKQEAATTNPSLIEAVCKILKKHNCKIFIGDSPFTNPENAFKYSGIDKVAKKYGKLLVFEQDELIDITDKRAKILKKFKIAKTIKDVDLIINMPKLKTHCLTKYTGAIKNLYGLIPGGMKQRLHLKARGDKKFSQLLVDIYQNIKPELTIMDAVISMQGEGPSSGDPINTKLILASKNGIALDIAATILIGLKPKKVLSIKQAVKRKLYPNYKFKPVGKKLPNFKFKIPSSFIISRTRRLLRRLFAEKPIVVDPKKCIKCGLCARHCPAKAIKLRPYPIVNKRKCIRCFCCIEICPEDALSVKQSKQQQKELHD